MKEETLKNGKHRRLSMEEARHS